MIEDAYRMQRWLTWAMLAIGIVALVLASVALARPAAKAESTLPHGDRPVFRRSKCNCGGGA
jgi:hypothetical protein